MVVAEFRDGRTKAYTKSLFQHDKGQRLSFDGIEVPENGEVHFSNTEDGGISYAVKIKDGSAKIPDAYLDTGEYIYAWLYAKLKSEGSVGSIKYHFDTYDTDGDGTEDGAELVVDQVSSSKKAYDNSSTLFSVVIPVIRRPNIFRVEDEASEENDVDAPKDMEVEIDDEENMNIINLGNTGDGTPGIQNYTIEGENFIFTH